MPQIILSTKTLILDDIYCTPLKTTIKKTILVGLTCHFSLRNKYRLCEIQLEALTLKRSWKENKNKQWDPAATLSWAGLFMGVRSDQRKNRAAAVGTNTLTSVDISSSLPVSSNTFFSQLWWQMLFIAHFSCVITEVYLSLYPYLQFKVIPHFQSSSLRTNVISVFKNRQTLTVWQTKHIIEYIVDKKRPGKALWSCHISLMLQGFRGWSEK